MLPVLNERIKNLLSEKRFSKTDISERLGIGYSTLWRRLNGERNVNLDFLTELAEVLGTTVSYLIGETDNPERGVIEQVSLPVSSGKTRIEENSQPVVSYAYWGGVVDEARRVVERGDEREITSVEPLLKLAYEIISVGREGLGQNVVSVNADSSIVAQMPVYGGHHNKNSMTLGASPNEQKKR